MTESDRSVQRVAPVAFPEAYQFPEKPSGPPAAVDAYRQTQFNLGADIACLKQGMELQLAVVRDSYPSQYRSHTLAAALTFWSRAYQAMADALLLTTRGSYSSAFPLVRTAADMLAAEQELLETDAAEWKTWLSERGIRQDERHKAWEFEMGLFRSGGVMSRNEDLGHVFRVALDLSMPNFGTTLALTGGESNLQRVAVVFADQAFHIGWAELICGFLIRLCRVQLSLALEQPHFGRSEETAQGIQAWLAQAEKQLTSSQRCRAEELAEPEGRRVLLHNVRRQPSGAPKKLLF